MKEIKWEGQNSTNNIPSLLLCYWCLYALPSLSPPYSWVLVSKLFTSIHTFTASAWSRTTITWSIHCIFHEWYQMLAYLYSPLLPSFFWLHNTCTFAWMWNVNQAMKWNKFFCDYIHLYDQENYEWNVYLHYLRIVLFGNMAITDYDTSAMHIPGCI